MMEWVWCHHLVYIRFTYSELNFDLGGTYMKNGKLRREEDEQFMQINKFKVCCDKRGVTFFILSVVGIEFFLLYSMPCPPPNWWHMIFPFILGILGFAEIFTELSFCVTVTECCINVRTKFARKYTFSCSEIDRKSVV